MRKGQSPLATGIILSLAAVYLIVFFSIENMWNVGTVMAVVLLIGLAAFQFIIHFVFLKDSPQNSVKKAIKQKKKM